MNPFLAAAEHGYLPDSLLRLGIRYLLRRRQQSLYQSSGEEAFAQAMSEQPVAVAQAAANTFKEMKMTLKELSLRWTQKTRH